MSLLRRALCLTSTLVFSTLLPVPVLAQQKANDSVAGRVLSATDGRPLKNALVSLGQVNTAHLFATVHTGEDGGFAFRSVPAGSYSLSGQAIGFTSTLYLQHDRLFTGIVTGAGLDTTSLTVTLTPSSSISGHVVDDTGEPVLRANIILYREQAERENRIAQFRSSYVNGNCDAFSFADLPPGHYFLAVTATPWYAVHPPPEQPETPPSFPTEVDPALDVTYPMTFYPAATRDTDASPIDLKPGDDFVADVHLAPVHALSIALPLAATTPSNRNGRGFGVSLSRTVFGHSEPVTMQMETFSGGLRVTGLTPGQYDLRANFQGTASRDLGPVTLGSESITLDAPPPPAARFASVHMSVQTTEGVNLAKNTVIGLRERGDASGLNLNQRLGDDSSVDFSEVPAGEYRFNIYGQSGPLDTAGLQVNGEDIPTKVLHVTGTGELKVVLTLGGKPVTVAGFVRPAVGKPFVPSMVVLVPAGKDTNADLFRRDQTNLDGSFALANVLPGDYLLVALEDAWNLRWNDPATLLPYLLHGLPFTVRPGGPQSIHLHEMVAPQTR